VPDADAPPDTPTPRARRGARRWRERLLLATVFCGMAGLGGFAAAWLLVCRGDACPSVASLGGYVPRQTSKLFAADGRFIAELGLERRTVVPLSQVPKVVTDAFLLTEDKRFYSHSGVDVIRVVGSVLTNVRAMGFAQGFSTITMQLARNIFPERLSREKSIVRKLKEMRVALEIERRFPKSRILELYLNQINLGSGAYGVETASQRYFGKHVTELNIAEAATLAAIPKAPGTIQSPPLAGPVDPAAQHRHRADAPRGRDHRRRGEPRQGLSTHARPALGVGRRGAVLRGVDAPAA
jgi:penicillin-binding protein 1A